ncbi:ubiquinol oxidase subunit II [Devosia sp. CN2-171]|uniref:ubiquinol oxidase subunit II n=1 Tax=Devosia sp. CN2-171 TaxID=3400909 RepID=UPI003BF921DB
MFNDTMLDPAGPVSAVTRDLFFDAIGLMLVVIVPVFVFTGLILWRYRASNTAAKYAPDWAGSRVIEIAIWFMPVLIVVMLWFVVWARTHELDPYKPLASTQPPLVVQAVALDWQWLFIYPEDNVASVNRLVFPVGRPLTLEITSDTVMNSLSIPALGGQIYAMAGMQTRLNLLADRAGTYHGRNTMFSGDGFSAQSFSAEAVDVTGYDTFLAKARAGAIALDQPGFEALAAPTIAGPVRLYSSVAPNLFQTIISSHGSMPHTAAGSAPAEEAMTHAEHAQ